MDIALFVFDRITALDIVGPYEVLARWPDARVRFVAAARGSVRTDNGFLGLVADAGMDEVDRADVLVVPGGFGTRALEKDERTLAWIRAIDRTTELTASVCTGALLLGAAGLLRDRSANTHWAVRERLRGYGAIPTAKRWVRDGKYATAAGVAAGIDLALALTVERYGEELAGRIQLGIEYDPEPPLDCGNPETVDPAIRDAVLDRMRAKGAL